MIKIAMVIDGNSIAVEGDVLLLVEARALVDQWFVAVSGRDQHQIEALTARAAAAGTALAHDVAATTSS